MEQKYNSHGIFEFQERFPDGQACMDHLEKLKWPDGFKCGRRGNVKQCKGTKSYSRQRVKCKYQASPTSGALFHKVKFPLLKAFYIMCYMSTSKKGVAGTELGRKPGLRQKTCWLSGQKVTEAMAGGGRRPLDGNVEMDETVTGGEEKGARGRGNRKKKLVQIVIGRKNKGISRMCAKAIRDGAAASLRPLVEKQACKTARIRTDGWTGHAPLKKDFPNLVRERGGEKGSNFPGMHRAITVLKAWLRGIHHSVRNLQAYLDEYTYRSDRRFMGGEIFENLMKRTVRHRPCPYSTICIH